MRGRLSGQAVVEAALASVVFVAVLLLVISVGWWAHAQNVVTAAAQEGARSASALGGTVDEGRNVAQRLLEDGLGKGASNVQLVATEDADSVEVSATGSWPVLVGADVEVGFPLGATSRMLKDRWR